MIFVFYTFAALLVYLSYKSFRGGIDYLNYFKSELAKPRSNYTPFATVIAPCKGLDEGLAENLAALVELDYPAYEVIFVVDDKGDPAVSVIERLLSRRDAETRRKKTEPRIDTDKHSSAPVHLGREKIKLIVAAKTTESSQKVGNLREAVLHAADVSRVFVFVDSDARPAREWLRHLAAPLEDESVGAATGYRWFISKKQTFGGELRSAWNASIASVLGANTRSNFCWGGSMAIRKNTFEKLDIRNKWGGTLSDDFAVTRAMNAAKMPIHFVPQALTASIENCTFSEMLEFTTRQMKITRVYAPHLWKLSFFGSSLFTGIMLSAFLIIVLSGQNTVAVWVAIATLAVVSFFSVGKSWLRLRAVRMILNKYDADVGKQTLSQLTLWLLTPPIFLYNCFAALFSRRMTWRGIRYELVSQNETRRSDLRGSPSKE
jgi:ceramide glucosyltransferase